MQTIDKPIVLTDDRGEPVPGADLTEPNPDSVILTDGPHGTAWQRYHSDGRWYRVGGGAGHPWSLVLRRKRNIVLVYSAPERLGR